MGLTSAKVSAVPTRLLAALRRAGMSAGDIAVEVLSPDNTWPKVRRKARAYLASGARLVWAHDPRRRTVTVYRPGAEPQLLRGEDVLSGEDVLPGFAVRVADLF